MTVSNSDILNALYAIAPQFADPTDAELTVYNTLIELLRCQVNEGVLKCCVALAFAYLLAHMLTLRGNPSLGVADSLKEGELSISLAIQADTSSLQSSAYGKAYLDLINRTFIGATVTNLPSNFNVMNYYDGCCYRY